MGVMMEISCPECSKKYKIDEGLIPDKGRKVKCKKCGSVFFVQKEQKSEEKSDFNVDLDFGQLPDDLGKGTVRISREQIQASINKFPEKNKVENDMVDDMKIELDIENPSPVEETTSAHVPSNIQDEQPSGTGSGEELYKVKIDGEEYPSLSIDQVIEWINEDRLLETDLIAREGSTNWINIDKVPKLKKVIGLHVYSQRKVLEEDDNPYKKFQQTQQTEVKKESFFEKLMSIFKKG